MGGGAILSQNVTDITDNTGKLVNIWEAEQYCHRMLPMLQITQASRLISMGGRAILSQNVTDVIDNTGKQVNIYGRRSNIVT